MKSISIAVKQFKKDNKIIFSTWQVLVHIAKKNDWKLTPFNKAKKLIREHKLENYVKNHRAFTYEYAGEIIILYRDNLKGYNRLYTISHEIGHIYLGHTSALEKSEDEEIEADEFAELLLNGYKKPLSIAGVLILTLITIAGFINLPSTAPEDNKRETTMVITSEPTTEFVTEIPTTAIITEPITEPTTEEHTESIVEQGENDETLYYVTAGGQKYHLKSCYQINPNRCVPLTLEQVENMGYSPCKTCRPNELN